jgi:hypothetical protein
MQPLSRSDMFPSIPSSSSSSSPGDEASVVHLFFDFLFDTSASASSTSLRISFMLKKNFPSIATCFPVLLSLYHLRTHNSSLYSAIPFRKRALSSSRSRSLNLRFTRAPRVEKRTIVLDSEVASYYSVSSSSELSGGERSRSFGFVISVEESK